MGSDVESSSKVCPALPKPKKRIEQHLRHRTIVVAVGLSVILTSTALTTFMIQGSILAGPIFFNGELGEQDVFLLRMDENGNLLWNTTYGSPLNDEPRSIVEVSTGGFAIVSKSYDPGDGDVWLDYGDGDVWLTRIDASGNVVWNETYPGMELPRIHGRKVSRELMVEMRTGGFAIFHSNLTISNYSILITDTEGQPVQILTLGSGLFNYGFAGLLEHNDGGFVFAGAMHWYGSNSVIYRIDAAGNLLWRKLHSSRRYSPHHSNFIEDTNGGYAFWVGGGQAQDGTLYHTDNQGNMTWTYNYTHTENNDYDIIQCTDGGFMLFSAGHFSSTNGCIRTNDEGMILWERETEGRCVELSTGRFVFLDEHRNYGHKEGNGFNLVCIDKNGDYLWNCTTDLPSCGPMSIIACDNGGFALTGSANSSGLSAALNDIPRTELDLFEIARIGGICGIFAAVILVVARKRLLTR